MVASLNRVKIVFGGTIGTTDTWSVGFNFASGTGTPSASDMNGAAAAAATLFATDVWDHTSGWKSQVNTTTIWKTCNAYFIPANSAVATVSGTVALTPDPGVNTTSFIPPQCALVVSLHTGLTGRRNSGRVYMPAVPALTTNGQVTSAVITNLAPLVAQFLTHMNSATTGPLTYNACIGTGNCPSITSTSLDSIVDTQRRRRDKQVAAAKVVATV